MPAKNPDIRGEAVTEKLHPAAHKQPEHAERAENQRGRFRHGHAVYHHVLDPACGIAGAGVIGQENAEGHRRVIKVREGAAEVDEVIARLVVVARKNCQRACGGGQVRERTRSDPDLRPVGEVRCGGSPGEIVAAGLEGKALQRVSVRKSQGESVLSGDGGSVNIRNGRGGAALAVGSIRGAGDRVVAVAAYHGHRAYGESWLPRRNVPRRRVG